MEAEDGLIVAPKVKMERLEALINYQETSAGRSICQGSLISCLLLMR